MIHDLVALGIWIALLVGILEWYYAETRLDRADALAALGPLLMLGTIASSVVASFIYFGRR